MNESTRTLSYVGVAAVSVLLAAFLAPSTPRAPDEFSEVGKPFFPDFVATDAASLTVVSFDEDTRAKVFNVELKDGKWVIGSHRNYPADGKDRLAKTAASVIGIKKEQFATKDPEQYASLQVVDPLDSDASKLKGRGQLITLKDASGKVLADYIIGKRVPNRDSYFYVRSRNEKSVYMAKLNIDLSTKFADWIESDLLRLQGENLNEIVINKYSIDKQRGRLIGQETNILKRSKPADPWVLEGLDTSKEEVNQDEVRTMTTALSDLKILGVREKPEGLSADLKTDKGIALDQLTSANLASKGFFVTGDGQLLSNEGEMVPITDGGVAYTLRFGEVFIGSELEMETGLEAENRKQSEKDGEAKKEEKGSNKSRYVFITAHFDPQAIGPKPVPPAAPAAPMTEAPATTPPADAAAPTEEQPTEANPADEAPAADDAGAEKSEAGGCQEGEAPPAAAPAAAPQTPPAAAAAPAAAPKGPTPEEAAKAAAVEAQKKYEQDLKAYEEKVAKGQKKVQELNERFADWYYVISEENFLKLRLSRKSLVKEKTAEAKPGEAAPGTAPANPDQPEMTAPSGDAPQSEAPPSEAPAAPATESPTEEPATETPASETPATEEPATEKPETEKPATEEPATEESATEKPAEPQPEEKPAEEKPATETPAEEKPAEEKPAAETPAEEKPAADESQPDEAAPSETPTEAPSESPAGESTPESEAPAAEPAGDKPAE